MSSPSHLPGWYPLMLARKLGPRPEARLLAGKMILLSRRHAGPVSAADAATGKAWPVLENGGWIFAGLGEPPADQHPGARLLDAPARELHLEGHVRAGVGDVGENILDTTHTSVVHQGYLRSPGGRRNVEARLEAGEGWVSATYPPGAAPSGWGARLLGAHRYTIRDTFRAPSIAEVSYTDGSAPVFAARFYLTPMGAAETYVAATIAVPGCGAVAALKLAALRLFFLRIFAEDRAVLELIGANRCAHGAAPLVFTPQDLLRPGIEAILEGRRPLAPAARVALKV